MSNKTTYNVAHCYADNPDGCYEVFTTPGQNRVCLCHTRAQAEEVAKALTLMDTFLELSNLLHRSIP